MIRFVGKDSYTPPENPEEGHKLAVIFIKKIEPIINKVTPYLKENAISERWFDMSYVKEKDFLSLNI